LHIEPETNFYERYFNYSEAIKKRVALLVFIAGIGSSVKYVFHYKVSNQLEGNGHSSRVCCCIEFDYLLIDSSATKNYFLDKKEGLKDLFF
jgi:hypothetical protein